MNPLFCGICLQMTLYLTLHVMNLYMLPVAVAGSFSDENAIRYLLPVLGMMLCLPIIGEAKATLIWRIVKITHQGQHRA